MYKHWFYLSEVSPNIYKNSFVNNWPKISIVIPNYNNAKYLESTILSIVKQNYPNLQLIVIDGKSTDGSVDIIKKYADKIDYWVSEPDNGQGDALNKGFKRADGEIMAWLNSDDMYYPWTFKVVAEIFVKFPHVQWLTGRPTNFDQYGRVHILKATMINKYDFLIGRYKWIQQESTFWTKNLWERAGGFISSNFKLMVDGELWARFFNYENLVYTSIALAGYRIHENNRAHNILIEKEMNQIITNFIKKNQELYLNLKKQLYPKRVLKILPYFIYNKIEKKIIRKTNFIYPYIKYNFRTNSYEFKVLNSNLEFI